MNSLCYYPLPERYHPVENSLERKDSGLEYSVVKEIHFYPFPMLLTL
jgi:hypothetical protein